MCAYIECTLFNVRALCYNEIVISLWEVIMRKRIASVYNDRLGSIEIECSICNYPWMVYLDTGKMITYIELTDSQWDRLMDLTEDDEGNVTVVDLGYTDDGTLDISVGRALAGDMVFTMSPATFSLSSDLLNSSTPYSREVTITLTTIDGLIDHTWCNMTIYPYPSTTAQGNCSFSVSPTSIDLVDGAATVTVTYSGNDWLDTDVCDLQVRQMNICGFPIGTGPAFDYLAELSYEDSYLLASDYLGTMFQFNSKIMNTESKVFNSPDSCTMIIEVNDVVTDTREY